MRVYTPIVNGRKATTPGEQGASLNVVGPVSQPATVDRLSEVADISRVFDISVFHGRVISLSSLADSLPALDRSFAMMRLVWICALAFAVPLAAMTMPSSAAELSRAARARHVVYALPPEPF